MDEIMYVDQAGDPTSAPIEPQVPLNVDLEQVKAIQDRMPAADPAAPVGSNKNPIRIIQQGEQFITTQDVSDEHLQQIIQVIDEVLKHVCFLDSNSFAGVYIYFSRY